RDVQVILFTVRYDANDLVNETHAVEPPCEARQYRLETTQLNGVLEADKLVEALQVVVGDDEFVVGSGQVLLRSSVPVRHRPQAGRTPFFVDRCDDSETSQHALYALEGFEVGLGQTNRDANLLGPLHTTVGIEEPSEEASVELFARTLD